MATPMTPAQSKAAFLAEGLKVVEIPGYQTNDRAPITGRPAGPKHGMVNHHTGGDTSNPYAYASGILFKGSSALVGPLCHEGLDPDTGTLYMVGTGRTNHAGGGDPAVLDAVINDAVPYDRELKPTKGNLDGVDGNAPFYGLEVMYSGARDVPRVGYVAMVKWNVARCRFHGWTGASCIAHREWSDDKPDPGHVNLPQLRRDIDAALALPAGVWPETQAPPPPPAQEEPRKEYDMRLVRNNTTDSTFDKGFGAIYLVGPAVWQHVPSIEQYNALKAVWGDYVDLGDGDLAKLRDAYWATIEALKVGLDPDRYSAPDAPADRSLDASPKASSQAPECADPDDPNNA